MGRPRKIRLRQRIVEIDAELQGVRDAEPARAYHRRAVEASNRGDVDCGWSLIGRVEECLIMGFGREQVRARATGLKIETAVGGMHNPGRRKAILELVTPVTDGARPGPDEVAARLRLVAAVRWHNEGATNEYRLLSLLRRNQRTLVTASVLVLAPTVGLLTRHAGSVDDAASLDSSWALVTVVCLGVLGALTSAVQRSTRVARDRTPRHLETLTASLSRIPIGAVAAPTVWRTFRAGAPAGSTVVPAMLLAGFGAGFSERLFTQDPPERPGPTGRV